MDFVTTAIMKKSLRTIRAVLFDFDGTLTRPDSLDLSIIKRRIGCPVDHYLLEYIESLDSPEQRRDALDQVDAFECQAAARARPHPGAEALIHDLRRQNIRTAILTRNSRKAVQIALRNFRRIDPVDFDEIITRDDPVNPKPSGDGVRLAAHRLDVPVEEMLVVGDYPLDVEAGRRAGAITVLLKNRPDALEPEGLCDFVITQLRQIKKIIRLRQPLPAGKLPNDLLQRFLEKYGFEDPAVIIKPGIGEDTAAVAVEGAEVLVLKSDPITFVTDAAGEYAVVVNANDIATSGARPRWFLTTLMFPPGTSAANIGETMRELSDVCRRWHITLCGGHTEITDAVTRPVVTGMMAGIVKRDRLIDKRNIRSGDRIFLTKGVAVEGTAIIAREFAARLASLGVETAVVTQCRRFLDWISILPEARIAAAVDGVSAMHDVTEGGLATALEELSVAGNHRMRVRLEQIPIYPETDRICGLLKINPLGLIGSGSLIICCRQYAGDLLHRQIRDHGISITEIGEVLEAGTGIESTRDSRPAPWPRFERDEITRLF
jgi:HAD superfamily hydrolase (TIGR01509 family)